MLVDNGNGQEIWDLYDEHGLPTGETHVRGQKIVPGRFHIVVHLCIFNSRGELLIQQRHKSKRGWPGLWDVSVGGSAVAGETAREGMQRETQEELGLTLDFSNAKPYFTVWGPDYFDHYFVLFDEPDLQTLVLEESEVEAVRWASWAQVEDLYNRTEFLPYSRTFLTWLFEIGSRRLSENFVLDPLSQANG